MKRDISFPVSEMQVTGAIALDRDFHGLESVIFRLFTFLQNTIVWSWLEGSVCIRARNQQIGPGPRDSVRWEDYTNETFHKVHRWFVDGNDCGSRRDGRCHNRQR